MAEQEQSTTENVSNPAFGFLAAGTAWGAFFVSVVWRLSLEWNPYNPPTDESVRWRLISLVGCVVAGAVTGLLVDTMLPASKLRSTILKYTWVVLVFSAIMINMLWPAN